MERPATLGNPDDPLAFNRPARAATCHLLASAIPARYRQRRELREDIANYLRDAAPMKARLATARILEPFGGLHWPAAHAPTASQSADPCLVDPLTYRLS